MTKSRNWIMHFEVKDSGVEASSKMQRGQNYKSFHRKETFCFSCINPFKSLTTGVRANSGSLQYSG